MRTQFTTYAGSIQDEERFYPGKFVSVSKIEGKVPRLWARLSHFVGHLPISSSFTESAGEPLNWWILKKLQNES